MNPVLTSGPDARNFARDNRGTAMLELAISVSFLAIVFFGLIRIAIALLSTQVLQQAAEAGLDTMNRIANLEQGTFTNLTPSTTCLGGPATSKCPGMLFTTERVRNMITRTMGLGATAGTYQFPLSNANIVVGYQAITTAPPGTPGPLEDRVWVRVQGSQPGVMGLASSMWAEKSGPYLYQGLGTGFTGAPVIKYPFGVWDIQVFEPVMDQDSDTPLPSLQMPVKGGASDLHIPRGLGKPIPTP